MLQPILGLFYSKKVKQNSLVFKPLKLPAQCTCAW